MKMELLFEKWLEKKILSNCKLRTYARYRDIVKTHLVPGLGDLEVGDLDFETVNTILERLFASGNKKTAGKLSGSSVNMIRTVLNSSFRFACEKGYATHNPVLSVPRIKNRPKKIVAFTQKEQREIEKAIEYRKDDRLIGLKLCLYTGLRIGELLALEWKDVDLNNGIIYVTKTLYRVKYENNQWITMIDSPKTQAGIRDIPIPSLLLRELRAIYKKRKSESVVCDKQGCAVKVRTYQAVFKNLLKSNGIRELNFHALRHTFATRALESGMDIKTLSDILGHEDETITIKTYCHSFMSTKKRAINKLNKFYQNASNIEFDE